jgi:hypothetical protein
MKITYIILDLAVLAAIIQLIMSGHPVIAILTFMFYFTIVVNYMRGRK